MLGVEVTAGNVHDSVAWDGLYGKISKRFLVKFVVMDAGYKTHWIAKKTLDDGKIPILPYTRYNGKKDRYKPWEYTYDPVKDEYICPQGGAAAAHDHRSQREAPLPQHAGAMQELLL